MKSLKTVFSDTAEAIGFRLKSGASALIVLAALLFATSVVEAQTVYPTVPAALLLYQTGAGNNQGNTNTLPGNSTNIFPLTNVWVTSGTTVTNTNVCSGILDIHKQVDFTPQVVYSLVGNTTNGLTIVWHWCPSTDGVFFDTNNPTYWVTDAPPAGSAGIFSHTVDFGTPSQNLAAVWLQEVTISATNVLTNVTVEAGPKKLLTPY